MVPSQIFGNIIEILRSSLIKRRNIPKNIWSFHLYAIRKLNLEVRKASL